MSDAGKSFRSHLTADLLAGIGSMRKYKPLWIGKVIGPIFQGVCLERSRDGKSYRPLSHIHSFSSNSECLTFSLCQRLKSGTSQIDESIRNERHEELFQGALAKLKRDSLLPLDSAWGVYDLVRAVEIASTVTFTDGHYPVHLYEAAVLAAAWIGNPKLSENLAKKYEADLRRRISGKHTRYTPESLAAWSESLIERAYKRESIFLTVEMQILKHKAQHLPRYEMTD